MCHVEDKTWVEDKIHVLRDARHPVWSQHLRCVNNVAGSEKENAPKQDKRPYLGSTTLRLVC